MLCIAPGNGLMTVCYRYTYPSSGTVSFKTAIQTACGTECAISYGTNYNAGCTPNANCSGGSISIRTFSDNCTFMMNGTAIGGNCVGGTAFVPGQSYVVCFQVPLSPGCSTYVCPVIDCSSGNCGCTSAIAANAGVDKTICGASSTTLAANNVAPSMGTWTVASGTGSFVDDHDRNTSVTGLSVGVNKFVWSVTCGTTTKRDTVSITRVNTPAANAGSPSQICLGKSAG